MEGKMYLGLFISWLIHLSASSSSGMVTSPAMAITTTTVSLSSFADDDDSMLVHSIDSDRTNRLVTSEETRAANSFSSISFQASSLVTTASPSRSIQSSRAHFISDQPNRTSMLPSVTVQATSGTGALSRDITHSTQPTPPLFATESSSVLSTSSLIDGPSFTMTSPTIIFSSFSTGLSIPSFTIREKSSVPLSLAVSLPYTDQSSGYLSTAHSMHRPASSPLDVTSLVDISDSFSRDPIDVRSSELGNTAMLDYPTTSGHSTGPSQQTLTLPLPTVSLQSLMNSAQESDVVVSSTLLQPSTSRHPLTAASFSHSVSGSENILTSVSGVNSVFETQQITALLFQTSGSLQPAEGNSADFETMYSPSDIQSTVNSQSTLTSILSSDTISEMETTHVPKVSLTASDVYSISSMNETIPSPTLTHGVSVLDSFISLDSMIESTVSDRSQFSSSVGEIWTSLSDDVTSLIVTAAIEQSSQYMHLETSTQVFIGLDTSEMFNSFESQSDPSISSSEMVMSSYFSTIMNTSAPQLSTLCAHCSTVSDMNLNSTSRMFHSFESQSDFFVSSSEIAMSSYFSTTMNTSVPKPSTLCAHCSTFTDMDLNSTSGMLHSFESQSGTSFSSAEIATSLYFSTTMSTSLPQSFSLCTNCNTGAEMDRNSTRLDPMNTLVSSSSLQNQTKLLDDSSTVALTLYTSNVSGLSSSISSIFLDSSTLRTYVSNDSLNTPSILSSISFLSLSLSASLPNINFTSVIMHHNMSTPVLTTPSPSSDYIKNLTLMFFLKGKCDFIMRNHYVFRKFWRSLLLYTEKASNLSIAQHDISIVETRCDPFRAVMSISTDNNTINIAETISNYFHSNSSRSRIFLHLNNGSKIEVIITHYQFIPKITAGSRSETKSPLSEIVVISVAAITCGILIIIGLVIFIREYLHKRKSEGFRFPAESCPERIALRSLPRTSRARGSSLEMKDAGSLSGAYNGPFESEYSTVGSQKGRKTNFMTRSDMSLSGRSKTKGRRQLSTGHATSTSSNGTARSQDRRGYGLVIGLLGYKPRSKEAADTYAIPSKKSKIQGMSIRSTEESAIEMPTLPRERPRRRDQELEGSPTPPPRHLRNIPKHKEATDSIERLVPSATKRNDEKGEGVINLAYANEEDRKGEVIGSTSSVHI